MEPERRTYTLGRPVLLRAKNDDAVRFQGHAAVFGERTWIGPKQWGWWEQVARGAFARAVEEDDVRFLYNHDEDTVMARTSSGTLDLAEDKVGLKVDAELDPADPDVMRLVPKLERGDVSQMSFAFTVSKETWEVLDDDTELRTIEAVDPLWDVSAVTFPAYEGTDAALRALVEARRAQSLNTRLLAARRRLATLQGGS